MTPPPFHPTPREIAAFELKNTIWTRSYVEEEPVRVLVWVVAVEGNRPDAGPMDQVSLTYIKQG